MTVYIEKPAVNLREELASLRNQGGYSEQQFHFGSLVTNGTFDSDTTGWTKKSSNDVLESISGVAKFTAVDDYWSGQSVTTVIGKSYIVSIDRISATSTFFFRADTALGGLGNILSTTLDTNGTHTFTFVATNTSTWVYMGTAPSNVIEFDNISVFETDGTDVIHTIPKGWKPKDVFEDGLLQREGAAHDYTVVYDGFDYKIKPAVAPSATTQTCVIGVKA